MIPMEYEPLLMGILFPFFEGFVLVKKARKCGFVNKVDEAIIQPAFNEAGNFSEGLALERVGELGTPLFINALKHN